MIENLFHRKAFWRVFHFFSRHPSDEYHLKELVRQVNLSLRPTHEITRKMDQEGILKSRRMGNLKIFYLNSENPVVRQLRVVEIIAALSPILEQLKPICNRVVLFGSCAEGTYTPESDVDLFVITDNKEKVISMASGRAIGDQELPANIVAESYQGVVLMKKNNDVLWSRIERGINLYEAHDE
tara:strand:+ start:79 stop:627 length:549 start_codon:yes stop_codon:yes gene_type:complete